MKRRQFTQALAASPLVATLPLPEPSLFRLIKSTSYLTETYKISVETVEKFPNLFEGREDLLSWGYVIEAPEEEDELKGSLQNLGCRLYGRLDQAIFNRVKSDQSTWTVEVVWASTSSDVPPSTPSANLLKTTTTTFDHYECSVSQSELCLRTKVDLSNVPLQDRDDVVFQKNSEDEYLAYVGATLKGIWLEGRFHEVPFDGSRLTGIVPRLGTLRLNNEGGLYKATWELKYPDAPRPKKMTRQSATVDHSDS